MNAFIKLLEKHGFWIVALFSAVLYLGTVNHGFVYDDEIVIIKNTHVQNGISGLSKIWTHNYLNGVQGYNDGLYRPLSQTVFAVIVDFFGNNSIPFHLVNIVVYALLGGFIFQLGKQLTGNITLGFVFALLFVAHPIHTEVVSNNKSLDELLAAIFGVLALYTVSKAENLSGKSILFTTIFFLLALFSKESSISLLLLIPFFYWFFYRKFSKQFITLTVVLLVTGVIWYKYHEHIIASMPNEVDKGLFSGLSNAVLLATNGLDKLATGCWITFLYLYKCIFPVSLSSDYSPNAIPLIPFLSLKAVVSALGLIGVLLLGLWGVKTKKLFGLGILIFFIMIAPVSNIFIQIGTSFGERLAFMPSLGIVLAVTWAYDKISFKPKFSMLLVLVAVMSIATINRSLDWKSNLDLYVKDVEKQPDSFRTHYNFATALSGSVGEKTGDQLTGKERKNIELAIFHFNATIKIKPLYADVYNNLGNAYRRLGNTEKAIETHEKLLKMSPSYSKASYNLAVTYYEIKKYKEAHHYFRQYCELKGSELAASWYHAGVCSGFMGNFKDAIEEFEESLKLDATKWEAWNYLGMAYGNSNNNEKALAAFEKAYSIAKLPQVEENLRVCREKLK